jgi:hypothetical protein
MIMRVITLLRGVMASWKVYTVSSALLWKPLAMQVRKMKYFAAETLLRCCHVVMLFDSHAAQPPAGPSQLLC